MNYFRRFCCGLFLSILLSAFPTFAQAKVYELRLDEEVTIGMASFVKRSLVEAKAEKAKAVVLTIDTYGGRVDSALEIVDAITSAKPLPIYAYVQDKAWSAGALIALACPRMVMREGSSIGSATPVVQAGGMVKPVEEKFVSALRAKFRSVAERNGYSPLLAEAMVDASIEAKEVRVNGKREFLTPSQIQEERLRGNTIQVIRTVIPKGKLLNLTAKEAVRVGFARQVVGSREAFLKASKWRAAAVIIKTQQPLERLANVLTNSVLTSLLLILGIILLYIEFQAPGLGWAGVGSAGCFLLFFGGRYILNLADWIEIGLFLVGVSLILAEVFVLPGFSVAGVLGVVCLFSALYFALVPFVIPQAPWELVEMQRALLTLMGSLTVSIMLFFLIMRYLQYIPLLRRLVLESALATEIKASAVGARPRISQEREVQIGMMGKAVTDLRPVGRADFSGELYDVIAITGMVAVGTAVQVTRVDGGQIYVRPC